MNKSISTAISYVFHPLMMPSMTFVILYLAAPEIVKPLPLMTLPFLFFTTFVIPVVSIVMLKKLGTIRSVTMLTREERVMPFFFITTFYGMTAYMFIFKIHVNEIVALIFVTTCCLLVLLSLVTMFFKVSIHAAGIAGVLGYLAAFVTLLSGGQLFYPMIAVLLLTGLVMTARLDLNAHTPLEIWSGALLGFAISFFAMICFL